MGDRLYRSRHDRMLAGVAGGLAEMWDADPSLVRVIWALLVIFTGGIALLVYIVMAIVVPDEPGWTHAAAPPASAPTTSTLTGEAPDAAPPGPGAVPPGSGWTQPGAAMPFADAQAARAARDEARAARRAARAERSGGMSVGVLLGGFLVLLGLFFLVREYLPEIDFDWFWPLVLVGVGILLVASAMGRGPRSGGPT